MTKIKNFFNNIYVRHFLIILGMLFSYLILDVGLRYFSNKYELVYKYTHASPLFFSVSWVIIFIGILYLFKKKYRMIFYFISILFFNILTIVQTLHMKVLNRFFGLSDFLMASEGSDYFLFALKKIDLLVIGIIVLSIASTVFTFFMIKYTKDIKREKYYSFKLILFVILLSYIFRIAAIDRLGEESDRNGFESSFNVADIYRDFNNQTKNIEVAGLYEQTFKNSYLFVKDNLFANKKELANEVKESLKDTEIIDTDNKYTGLFEGKNLILILMESIDSYLVNDDVMPTVNMMKNEGLNFTNRYSPTFGGGQTINSEFSALTGLYAIDNSMAIYNYDNNDFSYSLPALMKKNGYITDSIHANEGRFYNRSSFHLALGFNNHYALSDMKLDKNYDYFLDSNLIKNEEVYNLIVKDEKFMSFIVTYSAHLPYDNENKKCNNLYGLDENNTHYGLSCIKNLAHDTDEMIRLLIEKLERDNKLDDTVIVLVTDHYAYGYDETLKIKDVEDVNMAQNVPFIIWSNDVKHNDIDILMDTADIAPTLLNLFGISYDPNDYVGQDVFRSDRDNFIYFSNDVFYDGNLYYNDIDKLNNRNEDYVKDIINKIDKYMTFNRNVILGNYYKYK